MKTNNRELRDWFIITVIILIGFLCLIFAGSMALRFPSSWKLAANMDSLIDPNSDFLTRRPQGFIEPVDDSILTSAILISLFQTPGATVPQRTPLPTITPAPAATSAPVSTDPAPPTPNPTSTIIYQVPVSPTNTLKHDPANTPTATLPVEADLQITKDDGVLMYAAGSTLTYTIVVTNHGPANVIGAEITDDIPVQFDDWTWSCTSQNNGAKGCDAAVSNNSNFSDTVNLPNGASIEYTVTANISAAASGDLVNTASVRLPKAYLDSNTSNNSATDTNTPAVDLQITKDDGVTTYTPGGTPLVYQVVVTNNGTFNVSGATVADVFPAQISSTSWVCIPDSGATCSANGTGNINDTVDIPAGLSVRYSITASLSPFALGTLSNTARVNTPDGYTEIDTNNNSDTDSNTCNTVQPNIGLPDNSWISPPQGTSLKIVLAPSIVADGDVGTPDLVYYERLAAPSHIEMDWVQIEISSDGSTWYQIFYWGGPSGIPDTNTNVDVQNVIADICATELDNCPIPIGRLYNSTGITIDIDNLVPAGNYPWMQITSPVSPGNDPSDIDSIQPYYP